MIVVTQPKVQGFWPRWAPFKGFSLLFDTPGKSLTPFRSGLVKLDCQTQTAPEQAFYRRLATGLAKVDLDLLINNYLFCPLEPYSYHTTVWDGLNDSNSAWVAEDQIRPLHHLLGHFPRSFVTNTVFTEDIIQSPLVTEIWTIQFRLDHIAKWGNVGLVAVLKTADAASETRFQELRKARNQLYDIYEARFGLTMRWNFTPHVSLGYFANQEQAELASPKISQWHDTIQQEVGNTTITYHTISLYGFTDMITFFKRS